MAASANSFGLLASDGATGAATGNGHAINNMAKPAKGPAAAKARPPSGSKLSKNLMSLKFMRRAAPAEPAVKQEPAVPADARTADEAASASAQPPAAAAAGPPPACVIVRRDLSFAERCGDDGGRMVFGGGASAATPAANVKQEQDADVPASHMAAAMQQRQAAAPAAQRSAQKPTKRSREALVADALQAAGLSGDDDSPGDAHAQHAGAEVSAAGAGAEPSAAQHIGAEVDAAGAGCAGPAAARPSLRQQARAAQSQNHLSAEIKRQKKQKRAQVANGGDIAGGPQHCEHTSAADNVSPSNVMKSKPRKLSNLKDTLGRKKDSGIGKHRKKGKHKGAASNGDMGAALT